MDIDVFSADSRRHTDCNTTGWYRGDDHRIRPYQGPFSDGYIPQHFGACRDVRPVRNPWHISDFVSATDSDAVPNENIFANYGSRMYHNSHAPISDFEPFPNFRFEWKKTMKKKETQFLDNFGKKRDLVQI